MLKIYLLCKSINLLLFPIIPIVSQPAVKSFPMNDQSVIQNLLNLNQSIPYQAISPL